MKLITKENTALVIKYLKQLALGFSGGAVLLVSGWKFVTEPQLLKMIEDNNIKQDSIHNIKSGSFRSEWAVYLEVPNERVTFTLYTKLDSLTRFMYEAKKYEDVLSASLNIVPLYPFLDENGDEWQRMPDLRAYRVNYENGVRWIVYHGHRQNLGGF